LIRARAGFHGLPFSLDKKTMSATKQQCQLAKGTSPLVQLRVNAEYAGCSAKEVTETIQERYGKQLNALTVEEAQILAWEYAEISRRSLAKQY
jgi:hypothetical protein